MKMTIKQIWKVIELIQKNEAIFIGTELGLNYLSPYQKQILKQYGVDPDDFSKSISNIDRSFYFGMLAQTLGSNKSFNVKKKDFDKWFENELKKPLSTQKSKALEYLKNRTFTDITGLGNRFSTKVSNSVLTSSQKQTEKIRKKIKKKTIEAVSKNDSISELAGELRRMTEDWGRDFSRISDYVMQEAYGIGRAQQILEDYGDDAEVYKQTFPGVCKHCEKNYGTPGLEPIVYKLSDLISNGNNIGRKEQIPVIGPAHPWARSILHPKPKGSVWDSEKQEFVIQRNTQGIKRKSSVKIKIT